MSELSATLLAWLLVYSYPVAGVTVLVGAIGVPLPTSAVVLAAGAFAADGDPNPSALFAVILLAAVCGDAISYSLARWGSATLLAWLGPRLGFTPGHVAAVERPFERWGGLLVVVTRCLLTGLALPTNLVAGAGGYPMRRFIGYAILGEAIWTAELMGLGWWYGANWVPLLGYLEDASSALSALAAAALLALLLLRLLRSRPS